MVEDGRKIQRSNEDWKKILPEDVYCVTREKATEPAFSGAYYAYKEKGVYRCSNCGAELFSSDTKYDSGTGWPSFTAPVDIAAVDTISDTSQGMERTEIICARCGAHLGHMFDDGPRQNEDTADTVPMDLTGSPQVAGKRFCVNSASLAFEKKEEK